MLGAEGALMGTRFYASEEAQGHPEAKRRIVEASGDDTLRSIVSIYHAAMSGRRHNGACDPQ